MQELKRSKQTREKKSYGNNFLTYIVEDEHNNFLTYIVEDEHVSYYNAIKFFDTPLWLESFNKLLDYV